MATEIVKTIKVETVGADKSVKSLRDNIKQLRNDLLNLEKGTQEYDDTLNQIIKDETELTQVMKAGKDEVAQALKKVTGEYVTQKQELKALKVELEQLQPGTDAYNEKFARAAEITKDLRKQNEMLKYSSTDLGDQLSNMRGIAANMAAGFSAAQAAIGLFGGESKEVQQAMLKVQQAMALVQGLEGLAGFKDRTEGLSKSFKNLIKGTKDETQATIALTSAEVTNAAATKTQTVATEGATKAQKGLNAAIKSNPIGFILGLLALLIANWKTLTSWLGKAVGGFDKLKKSMNKFKATVSGVGNAIKKVLIVPIKEAINYVTTLGKVLWDALTLNWGEIKEDIKNGIDGAIDIVKDGYNVAANYAEGKEKEITKQVEKETKERAEKRSKELSDYIELMEAKEGSDWKFTEEGQAAYEEYFAKLEEMYKDDAEKYQDYQVQKANYDREVTEHKTKTQNDAAKAAADAAKKAQEELKKIESDYQSKVSSQVGSNLGNIYAEYDEKYKAFIDYYKNLAKTLDKSASATDKKLAGWLNDYIKKVEDYNDKFKVNGERIINETKAFLKGLSIEEFGDLIKQRQGEDYWEKQFGNLTDEKKLEKWNDWVERMGEKTALSFSLGLKDRFIVERNRLEKTLKSLVTDSIENSSREANTQLNDEIIKLFQKTIVPNVDDELSKLQLEIAKKKIKLDFEVETGMDFDSFNKEDSEFIPIKNFDKKATEFERAATIFNNSLEQIRTQLNYYQQTVDYVNSNPDLIPSNEYKNALAMIEQLTNQAEQLKVDYYNTQAEIRDKYFAEDLNKIQTQENSELLLAQRHYNELFATESNFLNDVRILSGLRPGQEQTIADETFRIQKESLTRQLEAYQTYLSDVTVNGEQRVEAEKMVATLIAQIEDLELQHTVETNDKKIQSFMFYYSVVQDGVQQIGGLIGSLADYYETNAKALKDAGKITQEEYEEEFERIRGIKLAEAWINTISGSIGAFMQAVSTYPWPTGPIIGGIAAAATFASGMAQIAQIKAQKPDGSSSPSAMATPQTQVYEPSYVENPTNDNEVSNLRNAYMEQPIYVRVSDIDSAQEGRRVRTSESSF